MDKSWISLPKWDKRYGKGVMSFWNMRWLMLTGIQFSIARARNVSVAAICIDFPLTKYGST